MDKVTKRQEITEPGMHHNADSWWREAKQKKTGVYAGRIQKEVQDICVDQAQERDHEQRDQ